MFRRSINFDENSFLELASRITGKGENLLLSLRGLKNNTEATIASVVLDRDEVKLLIEDLNAWLESNPKTLGDIASE